MPAKPVIDETLEQGIDRVLASILPGSSPDWLRTRLREGLVDYLHECGEKWSMGRGDYACYLYRDPQQNPHGHHQRVLVIPLGDEPTPDS